MPPTPDSAHATASPGVEPARLLRRRVRLARRHLGPGPYLDYGCGHGALLVLLAARGSATGFVADPTVAELARTAAPGCPVHTHPEALPSGVFRGILAVTTTPADPATLATWHRVLVPRGRVLVVGVVADRPDGFTPLWAGREGWRSGAPVVVLGAR
jgi:SAM-dependent methyltransferase